MQRAQLPRVLSKVTPIKQPTLRLEVVAVYGVVKRQQKSLGQVYLRLNASLSL
jgi:hypothetical protein